MYDKKKKKQDNPNINNI